MYSQSQQPYEASPVTQQIRIDIPDARILITVDDSHSTAKVTVTSSDEGIEPEITELGEVLTVAAPQQLPGASNTTIANNFDGPVGTVITAGNVDSLNIGGGKISMEGVSTPPSTLAGSTIELVVPSRYVVSVRPDNTVTTTSGTAVTNVTIQRI